jgi:hypothetical protein
MEKLDYAVYPALNIHISKTAVYATFGKEETVGVVSKTGRNHRG